MPLNEAVTELRLVAHRAAERLAASRRGANLDDLRTEVIGDLLEALDRIDPHLGTKLMIVMYPHADAQFPSTQVPRA